MFKITEVILVHKSGNKQQINNYCLISLLPNLSKVLEKLVKTRLVKFFEKNRIFYDYQYGFKEKHSMIRALLDVISPSYDAIQKNRFSGLLLMNFRKAFEMVSHYILLKKFCRYGIRGPTRSLIKSCLTDGKQYVSNNNCNSTQKPVEIGVPQGSILGPLFYLIYVSDIFNALPCKPCLFADDTCLAIISSSLSDLENQCNSELQHLYSWCSANKLQINPTKSVLVVIPLKINNPEFNINLLYMTFFNCL